MLVGCLEKGYCQCIGLSCRDKIFETHKEALAYYRTIKVTSKYGIEYDDETGKKKRKSRKSENDEEDNEYENTEYESQEVEETDDED